MDSPISTTLLWYTLQFEAFFAQDAFTTLTEPKSLRREMMGCACGIKHVALGIDCSPNASRESVILNAVPPFPGTMPSLQSLSQASYQNQVNPEVQLKKQSPKMLAACLWWFQTKIRYSEIGFVLSDPMEHSRVWKMFEIKWVNEWSNVSLK